jgi:hypothetical protein
MSLFTKKQTTEKATTPIQEELYLVTKAVDTNSLPKEVLNTDLELLTKAEGKRNYRSNIAKSIRNPQISRAVSALQLKNPFKGI